MKTKTTPKKQAPSITFHDTGRLKASSKRSRKIKGKPIETEQPEPEQRVRTWVVMDNGVMQFQAVSCTAAVEFIKDNGLSPGCLFASSNVAYLMNAMKTGDPAPCQMELHIVTAGDKTMMASHHKSDADVYVKTYNRLRKQSTPPAVIHTKTIEL